MSKIFTVVVSLALIVGVAVSPVWAVGDKVRSDKAAGPAGDDGGEILRQAVELQSMRAFKILVFRKI
jgi:hypothetical protein